ncbi:flagellar protein FliT [Vibrio nereis]|uniref:Flagellar protein FliT n=1 Tax=Vibrio nereis TaxID=693 RepID=A0A0M0HP79_VIBNE|nr:flagellar protein FliT [Vibrio nereis]KOO03879.1 flagellar rod protein FlaI [Vibrio nereis]
MHLRSEFEQLLDVFCEVNHNMSDCLIQEEIDTEEITSLVDTREQLLQKLLQLISQNGQLASLDKWQNAIEETQAIAGLMQEKTNQIGLSLRKYQHGKRSVQQYRKFI